MKHLSLNCCKTLWEKGKMLVNSIFYFFPTMFSELFIVKVVKTGFGNVVSYCSDKLQVIAMTKMYMYANLST